MMVGAEKTAVPLERPFEPDSIEGLGAQVQLRSRRRPFESRQTACRSLSLHTRLGDNAARRTRLHHSPGPPNL